VKVFIIDTDQFLSNLIGAEQQRDTSETARILREMGLITGECNCKHCVAERAAMDAQEGDELVNAFIRGFNFKATEGATTQPELPVRLTIITSKDLYEAHRFAAKTIHKLELPETAPKGEDVFYQRMADHLNGISK